MLYCSVVRELPFFVFKIRENPLKSDFILEKAVHHGDTEARRKTGS